MAVKAFYFFLRPALEALKDSQVHDWREVKAAIVTTLGLSEADLLETVASGTKTCVDDRVSWALTYLRQAGLVEKAGKGNSKITQQGLAFLTRAEAVIHPNHLLEFPAYVAFKTRRRTKEETVTVVDDSSTVQPAANTKNQPQLVALIEKTPTDVMDESFAEQTQTLAQDLQSLLKAMEPARFERLIVQLMLRLGYGGTQADAGQVLGRSNDQGVDGVISEDKLGLEKIYLQAKRYADQTVGREEVQAFVGALVGKKANKGVFMTTSTF